MPDLALLKVVRSDDDLKKIPFVMVTDEAQKNNIVEAFKEGVSNYVVKPFTVETISKKITEGIRLIL